MCDQKLPWEFHFLQHEIFNEFIQRKIVCISYEILKEFTIALMLSYSEHHRSVRKLVLNESFRKIFDALNPDPFEEKVVEEDNIEKRNQILKELLCEIPFGEQPI